MRNESVLRTMARVATVCVASLLPLVSAHAALAIQHWVTPEGARVYFVEARDIPMLDVAIDFPAGSARDPASQPGLAALAHGLLDQGAAGLSDEAIAHKLADIGAGLGGRFDRDRAGVTLRTLSSPAEREIALVVLASVVQKPDYKAAILVREKARLVAALREAEADPGSVAAKAFFRTLYNDHPYAHDESGTVESVGKITRTALAAFHRQHYTAPNAVIALMGDVSRAEAEAIATQLAAGLPKGAKLAALPAATPAPGKVVRLTHPTSQSHVLVGAVGVSRADPDYWPLFVGNYVLGGGGFDSQLMREVRDKNGYAYSAYSYFMPMAVAGPFQMGLQTKTETVDAALKVAQDTLKVYIANGPTEAELSQARSNLIGGFPLRIDSNKKILEYLSVIGFYDLPLDYLDTWEAKVDAVKPEDVKRAFQKRLPESALSVVIVGAVAEAKQAEPKQAEAKQTGSQ